MRSPVNAYSLASSRLVCSGHVIGPPSAATRPTTTWGSARWAALRHEHDVGQGDEAAPETDGRPVHRGDHRHPARTMLSTMPLARVDALAAERSVVGQLVEVVEVAAGRERPAVARDHDDARLGVGV